LAQKNPKILQPLTQETLNWIDSRFLSFNSNLDIRTRTSKQPYLLAAWLRRHFYLQIDSNAKDFNENHRPICRSICNLFDADVAVIYTYHHAEQSLKLMTSWFADKDDKQYEDRLAHRMATLNADERMNSICYRSIEYNTVQFTLSYNPETKEAHPEGYRLCGFQELLMRSAIAVPILFKGRILGILEIAGKKEYQFGWTNREILNQTSIVLSSAFYQQRLVSALHKINTTALNIKEDTKLDSYNKICKYLASIFLCDGVSLWFKSEKDRNYYNCLGTYNNEYINRQLTVNPTPIAYTADDANSLTAKILLNDNKLCTKTYKIGTPPLDDSWLDSAPFRKKLKEQGIEYFTAFSLKDEKKEFCGSISLYDRNNLAYDDWESMFIFASNFVSVVLEAVNVLAIERQIIKDQKDHEVTGAAKAILERLGRFFYLTNTIKLFDDPESCLKKLSDDKKNASDIGRRLKLVKLDLENQKSRIQGLSKEGGLPQALSESNIELLSIHDYFHSASSSHFTDSRNKGIECKIQGSANQLIQMDKNDLIVIFNNLISNAIKYSVKNTDINAIFENTDEGWQFRIENHGYSLGLEERDRIFQNGFRSKYASENDLDGKGLGLTIVRDTCNKYGIDAYYTYRDVENVEGQCWHIFVLEIPDKMIKTKLIDKTKKHKDYKLMKS